MKSENSKPIPEKRKIIKDYIKQHNIENIVGEMINSVICEKELNPYIYMIKYLGRYISEEEKEKFNIVIPKPYPLGYPIVKYPKFQRETSSLLKKFLDKLVWNSIKIKKTFSGLNINNLTILSDAYPMDPIGCIITEGECLIVFSKLFFPLLSSLHNIIIDQGYKPIATDLFELMYSDSNYIQTNEDLQSNLQKLSLSWSRNVSGYSFNYRLAQSDRNNIEQLMIEEIRQLEVNQLISKCHQLSYEKDIEECQAILNSVNFDLEWLTKLNLDQGIYSH